MEAAYRAALACLSGMSVLALPKLIALAGGAGELWEILSKGGDRAAALVGLEKAVAWAGECRTARPKAFLDELTRKGIKVVAPGDASYPPMLAAIYDPPAALFMRGEMPPAERPFVAIVGSRKASSYGALVAQTLGEGLSRLGITVVSGAAYGVDCRAHLGSLRAGGITVAVLGCGVDRAYPPSHAGLLRQVASRGCVLSEFPPGADPLPWHFPHRNRIIAGLSHAVVVVEASERSGALITAEIALEEGREVMAVPGPVGSPLSRGTNGLIQKGAKLVMEVSDICEELPQELMGWIHGNARERGIVREKEEGIEKLAVEEAACLDLLRDEPHSLDWLAAKTGMPPGELLARLASLSLRGLVSEEAGGRYRSFPLLGNGGR